jgi:hypothetical protein
MQSQEVGGFSRWRCDARLGEVVALEQQRKPGDLGERIRKAVAEIEPGRVIASAVGAIGKGAIRTWPSVTGSTSSPTLAMNSSSSELSWWPILLSRMMPTSRRLAAEIAALGAATIR